MVFCVSSCLFVAIYELKAHFMSIYQNPNASSAAARGVSFFGKPAAASAPPRSRRFFRLDGFFAGKACRVAGGCQSARSEAPAAARQGQERHFPLHVRRPQPHRHVRLQTQHGRHGRQNGRRQNLRPRRQTQRRRHRRAALEIPPTRRMRQMGQRPVPPPRRLRRRHRLPPLDDGRVAHPRLRPVDDELRPPAKRQPRARLVGQLRPRLAER